MGGLHPPPHPVSLLWAPGTIWDPSPRAEQPENQSGQLLSPPPLTDTWGVGKRGREKERGKWRRERGREERGRPGEAQRRRKRRREGGGKKGREGREREGREKEGRREEREGEEGERE